MDKKYPKMNKVLIPESVVAGLVGGAGSYNSMRYGKIRCCPPIGTVHRVRRR